MRNVVEVTHLLQTPLNGHSEAIYGKVVGWGCLLCLWFLLVALLYTVANISQWLWLKHSFSLPIWLQPSLWLFNTFLSSGPRYFSGVLLHSLVSHWRISLALKIPLSNHLTLSSPKYLVSILPASSAPSTYNMQIRQGETFGPSYTARELGG